jgi:hypothetical protein
MHNNKLVMMKLTVLVSKKVIFVIKCNFLGCKRLKTNTHLNKKTGFLLQHLQTFKTRYKRTQRPARLASSKHPMWIDRAPRWIGTISWKEEIKCSSDIQICSRREVCVNEATSQKQFVLPGYSKKRSRSVLLLTSSWKSSLARNVRKLSWRIQLQRNSGIIWSTT